MFLVQTIISFAILGVIAVFEYLCRDPQQQAELNQSQKPMGTLFSKNTTGTTAPEGTTSPEATGKQGAPTTEEHQANNGQQLQQLQYEQAA